MTSQHGSSFHFNPAILAAIAFGIVEFAALQFANWRKRPALTAPGTTGSASTVAANKAKHIYLP